MLGFSPLSTFAVSDTLETETSGIAVGDANYPIIDGATTASAPEEYNLNIAMEDAQTNIGMDESI